MSPLPAALLSVGFVSLASLAGSLGLGLGEKKVRHAIFVLVALAVGALFGDVFFHLLPELYGGEHGPASPSTPYFILGGFLGFFALEKFIRWRHCHLPEGRKHAHPVVGLALVGDSAHNLLDGLMIAAAYQVDLKVGFATTVAVFLHEIPQELGDYGVLLHGGLTPRQALGFNVLSALVAFVGLGLAFLFQAWAGSAAGHISAFSAGAFLYLAGSDLVPELHHETDVSRSALQFAGIFTGLGLMALLARMA